MPSQLKRYDEAGHIHFWTISCFRRLQFFHDDIMKGVVIEGLRLLQKRFEVCLVGYVTMLEHVHVLLYPHAKGADEPIPISRLLHAFKQYVGHRSKAYLRQVWRRQGRLWSPPLNDWAHGRFKEQRIWNVRGYDFNIVQHDTLIEKLNYCHANPIARDLVGRAEDWPWSSYRFYENLNGVLLPMDWDGSWPIEW